MNTTMAYISPFICAALAWCAGELLAYLVFRPRKRVSLGFFSIHGLLPRRQAALAQALGDLVAQELLTAQDMAGSMDNEEFRARLKEQVDTWLDRVFTQDSKVGTVLGLVLKDSTKER